MEIKECKSSNIIIEEMKQKLTKIGEIVKSEYKKTLCVYHPDYWNGTHVLAQMEKEQIKLFNKIIIATHPYYKDMVRASFNERKLEITIMDSSEFLYPIVKEEFTKFSEENKNSIKSLCFVKDF